MPQIVFERQAPASALIHSALADSVNRPFWGDDVAARRRAFPQFQGRADTALAIVGGGFLGLWTAILAKERDPARSVVLLEAQRVGWAASGRNGGFCEASLTHGEENGHKRWPEEMAELEAQGLRNLDEIEATIRRYGIDCDFERTGVLVVAVEPYQDEQLRGEGYMSAAEIRAELNSPTFLSGIWEKDSTAMIHPGKLALELARVASELGVQIHEQSAVIKLQSRGRQVTLHTAQGQLSAARVVLATNAFPSLLKRYRWHTIPVYDYVLMTEPLTPEQLASIGWQHRQGIADMANQFHYYRITRDNRILFGGYDAVYNFGGKVSEQHDDRPESFERLASHFFTTFPQLAGLRFSHRWGGAIDTSTRFCAFFALARGGKVAYAAGFTGLGVGATRFAGNVLLDKLDGLDTERTRLRMVREIPPPFPPEPLAYVAVQATRWSLNQADHNHGKRNLMLRTMDALGLGFDS
ncbi:MULTISPECIES: NAD(P)/FAD-dependent oxidoreductase [Aquitalea]|uniref:Glycine/D-amino acid oxidase-like deaminating enzyme n=2 Tax=Aquitalea magnusonii TaxID=332411 RepID=A0A318IYR2_9NEIS|nr:MULTISPECIES: FAD-dependent oxidoreductase [Aquitalea]PXX40063.1 glycine/D-amino acid oxidase-like deaminating enzyme [Aquitalea magnusonii]